MSLPFLPSPLGKGLRPGNLVPGITLYSRSCLLHTPLAITVLVTASCGRVPFPNVGQPLLAKRDIPSLIQLDLPCQGSSSVLLDRERNLLCLVPGRMEVPWKKSLPPSFSLFPPLCRIHFYSIARNYEAVLGGALALACFCTREPTVLHSVE